MQGKEGKERGVREQRGRKGDSATEKNGRNEIIKLVRHPNRLSVSAAISLTTLSVY